MLIYWFLVILGKVNLFFNNPLLNFDVTYKLVYFFLSLAYCWVRFAWIKASVNFKLKILWKHCSCVSINYEVIIFDIRAHNWILIVSLEYALRIVIHFKIIFCTVSSFKRFKLELVIAVILCGLNKWEFEVLLSFFV